MIVASFMRVVLDPRRAGWMCASVLGVLCAVAPAPAQPATPGASQERGAPPAGAGTGTPAAAPAAATALPTPAAISEAAKRTLCSRVVSALVEPGADRAVLKDPVAAAIAQEMPELVTCAAVAGDSDELCKLVSEWRPCPTCEPVGTQSDKGQRKDCKTIQTVFHELRQHPKGRSFVLPFTLEECRGNPTVAASCEPFFAAMRAGDVAGCANAGLFESLCKALLTLDKAQCKPVKGLPKELPQGCRELIDSASVFGHGLDALAESGVPKNAKVAKEDEWLRDPTFVRALAGAALGRAHACQPLVEAETKACLGAPAHAWAGLPAPGPTPASGGGEIPREASHGTPAAGTPAAAPPAAPAAHPGAG